MGSVLPEGTSSFAPLGDMFWTHHPRAFQTWDDHWSLTSLSSLFISTWLTCYFPAEQAFHKMHGRSEYLHFKTNDDQTARFVYGMQVMTTQGYHLPVLPVLQSLRL
jgi:hypothetical protein